MPLTDCTCEKGTLGAETSREGMLPDFTTQVCEVWAVSGTLTWVVESIPIPDRAVDWANPSQASLALRTYFLSYTSGVTALPLFHLFRVVPIATLPILFDQSLLYGLLLISLLFALYTGSWLLSTSSQAAQIPKRGCSILLHSSTHHAHFRRHCTSQSSNSYPHPQREASFSNFGSHRALQKPYAFLTFQQGSLIL